MGKCLRVFRCFEQRFANQRWKLEFTSVMTPGELKELTVRFLEAVDRSGVPC
jgi:hypothetical protein